MFRSLRALTSIAVAAAAALSLGAIPPLTFITVDRAQREALVFVTDPRPGSLTQQALASLGDSVAEPASHAILDSRYAAVTYVRGPAATRARLSDELDRITARTSVKAVDLFLLTHGESNAVQFSSSPLPVSMTAVKNDILLKLDLGQRRKLRAVYSTASFGASHFVSWRQAGFRLLAGSRGICADVGVSYRVFLVRWASGTTFEGAVAAANAADGGDARDDAARAMYIALGRPDLAMRVDSQRVVSTFATLRIHTMIIGGVL